MVRISKNFQLAEFLRSEIAARRGYQLVMDRWTHEQITRLVNNIMQPVRDELGVPVIITSGYRPAWLNRLVRGSNDSRHMYGCACDWIPVGMTLPMAFKKVHDMDLSIDQLILEHDEWIHCGIALPGQEPRKQYMIATRRTDGAMRYEHYTGA